MGAEVVTYCPQWKTEWINKTEAKENASPLKETVSS